MMNSLLIQRSMAVSYTHLDVYKRQLQEQLSAYENAGGRAQKFLKLTERHAAFTELTPCLLYTSEAPKNIENGITFIVGKPGVGKSHFVNELKDAYPDAIVYRFWIGSQLSLIHI